MSEALNAEIASTYGCLDTLSVLDGDASHAHVLRELARSTNRLLEQPSPVLNVVFDSSTDSSEIRAGSSAGFLGAYDWRPVVPGPLLVPKKANHGFLDFKIIANITNQETCTFQVATTKAQFDAEGDTSKPGVIEAEGLGTWAVYDVEGVPASTSEVETVGVFMRGSNEGTTASAATFGSPATGSGDFFINTLTGEFKVDSATWNTRGSGNPTYADSGKHVILITSYTTGALLIPPCRVSAVTHLTSATTDLMRFTPPPRHGAAGLGAHLENVGSSPTMTFTISTLTEFRIANICGYSRAGGV